MDILNTLSLKSNRQIKINFGGGDLSGSLTVEYQKKYLLVL